MTPFFRMCLCLIWLFSTPSTQAQKTMGNAALPSTPKRMALLIGNNEYDLGIPPLQNPERDVDALRKVLESMGFQVIAYKNCSLAKTQQVYTDFLKQLDQSKPEVAWIYFSGHGLGVNGTNYLLPTDTNIGCIEQLQSYEAVSLNRWIDDLLQKQIKHNFIFLDACRDLGKLTHCNGAAVTGTVQGLSKPSEKYRRLLIAFATTEGNTADDNRFDANNSLFTAEFLKYLPTPGIGIRQVLDLTKQGTYLRSGQTQDPKRWDDLVEDYVFLPTQSQAVSQPALAPKVISVIAYKPDGKTLDYDLAKATMEELKKMYPEREVRLKASGKGVSGTTTSCTVRRRTTISGNPVNINGTTYNLVKAETRLILNFREGKEEKDNVELSEVGTGYQERVAIQNSIERALGGLKNVKINFD